MVMARLSGPRQNPPPAFPLDTKTLFEKLKTDNFTDFYCENIKNLFYFLNVLESAQ